MKTVLFDLDGTLLPMDQEAFTKGYFKLLAAKLAPYGYEPKPLIDAIWAGTAAMVKNNGKQLNETVFWDCFSQIFGERVFADRAVFEEFYAVDFQQVRGYCGYNSEAAKAVARIKALGYQVVLATNPIFPAIATESRTRWAGLEPEDFALYTTYENIGYCKPNPEYYREILRRLNAAPEDCLMVGNDAIEDVAAQETGMQVFLLTDCLINKDGKDISTYPRGSFADLLHFIETETGQKALDKSGEF